MRSPGVAKLCFKTCATFIGNPLKDRDNEKFRKVNLENAAVAQRVGKINGGIAILKAVGFKQADDGNYLVLEGDFDEQILKDALDLLKPHYD